VLVAAGRERGHDRTRCWLTTLATHETADSWWAFLAQLDADPPPFRVGADSARAIRKAVAAPGCPPCRAALTRLAERARKRAAVYASRTST
jgi:hypothetical protein